MRASRPTRPAIDRLAPLPQAVSVDQQATYPQLSRAILTSLAAGGAGQLGTATAGVIQFDFRGGPTQGYWLLIEPNDVSVCLKHPGHDIDVLVTADIMAFYRVWLGRSTLAEAVQREPGAPRRGARGPSRLPALVRLEPDGRSRARRTARAVEGARPSATSSS